MMEKGSIAIANEMARRYYSAPGNSAGGRLHIVLNDVNIKDKDIQFCIDAARDAGDDAAVALGEYLLTLSMTQRTKLCARCDYARKQLEPS